METKPRRILLVDDDPDYLDLNRRVLEAHGYPVDCAYDPNEALEKMGAAPPDLVVTDLMMDALDAGFSFARKIREAPEFRAIPVIILTAISRQRGFDFSPRNTEELRAMCADAFLEKPVPPPALLAKVKELLERRGKR